MLLQCTENLYECSNLLRQEVNQRYSDPFSVLSDVIEKAKNDPVVQSKMPSNTSSVVDKEGVTMGDILYARYTYPMVAGSRDQIAIEAIELYLEDRPSEEMEIFINLIESVNNLQQNKDNLFKWIQDYEKNSDLYNDPDMGLAAQMNKFSSSISKINQLMERVQIDQKVQEKVKNNLAITEALLIQSMPEKIKETMETKVDKKSSSKLKNLSRRIVHDAKRYLKNKKQKSNEKKQQIKVLDEIYQKLDQCLEHVAKSQSQKELDTLTPLKLAIGEQLADVRSSKAYQRSDVLKTQVRVAELKYQEVTHLAASKSKQLDQGMRRALLVTQKDVKKSLNPVNVSAKPNKAEKKRKNKKRK